MLYSVWNPSIRAFDYYDSPGTPALTNAPKPDHLRARELGSTIEQAAWPLPADAVKVGRGLQAQGMVAVTRQQRQQAMAGDDAPRSLLRSTLYLAGGALAAALLLGSRTRRR